MKIGKLQADMLKAVISSGRKEERYKYGILDDILIGIVVDKVAVYLMQKADFYINLDKLNGEPLNLSKMFEYAKNAGDANKTNELRQILLDDKKQHTLVKIQSENDFAWVDVKLLEPFDTNATFKVKNARSPVYVYENDNLVGAVLPVAVKDGD